MIVAETPTSIEPAGLATSSSQFGGDLTETNGFNCTQGASGFATPCTTVKAGAARITRDAVVDTAGTPATLYVNLVASAKPLLYPMQRLKKFHRVTITPGSGLRVLRYTPPLPQLTASVRCDPALRGVCGRGHVGDDDRDVVLAPGVERQVDERLRAASW